MFFFFFIDREYFWRFFINAFTFVLIAFCTWKKINQTRMNAILIKMSTVWRQIKTCVIYKPDTYEDI